MRDRSLEILEATVREFIRTGLPVSSAQLYAHYDFGIKPASIRIELTELTDEGYLEQPHHAAGRVPSDAGYAFYAERALGGAQPQQSKGIADALRDNAWDELAERLAEATGTIGIVADLGTDGYAFTRGIPSFVERMDWENRRELAAILRDIESIDQRIAALKSKLRNDPQLFIGKRNPVATNSALAAVAAQYSLRGHPFVVIAVGPKRMDYDRAAEVFAAVEHLINQD
jgi:transcriptional regulator of heat shock response